MSDDIDRRMLMPAWFDTPGRRAAVGIFLVLVVSGVLFVAWGLIPFHAAGGLPCKALLRGATPTARVLSGPRVGREPQLCRAAAGSRWLIGAIAWFGITAVGIAAVVLPHGSWDQLLFWQE